MSSSVEPLDAQSGRQPSQPLWSVRLAASLRGLCVARETGCVLVWNARSSLFLVNRSGELQARTTAAGTVTAACAADDGSACAAVGERGEVWRLTPDLMPRWASTVPQRAIACALDPFGRYLAVADAAGGLHFFDARGRRVGRTQTPRPLVHLAFVPEEPLLVGCADFGFVGCFEPTGRCAWRDGLVAHIGGLAVNGDGSRIVLACFTDGLRSYSVDGRQLARVSVVEACRLVASSYDGRRALVGGLGARVHVVNGEGQAVAAHELDSVPTALGIGALADVFFAAGADGRVTAVQLR